MMVKVREEDIRIGTRKNCYTCPVARALQRHYDYAEVLQETCYLGVSYDDYDLYELPKDVTDWINAYDRGEPVKPFEFTL